MDPSEKNMQRVMRRAYEVGRLRFALRALILIIPLIALTHWAGTSPSWALPVGGLLALTAIFFLWYGRTPGRSAWPALLAGIAPMSLPLLVQASGFCTANMSCRSLCLVACVVGGLVAGGMIGYFAARHSAHPWREAILGSALAGLVGTLGCSMLGIAGFLGILGAALVASFITSTIVASPLRPI